MSWLLWVIIVGLIAGWAAGKIMGKGGYGPLMDIVLGIVGGIIGGFLLSLVGLSSSGGIIGDIVVGHDRRGVSHLAEPYAEKSVTLERP